MRKAVILAGIVILAITPILRADEEKPTDTTTIKPAEKKDAPKEEVTIKDFLIGEWIIAPRELVPSGDITFNDNSTFVKNEKHKDSTGVGMKGQYLLYEDQKPCGIDLCLEKCGQPGSEWTTLFGIVRVLEDGRAEIRTSPDSNRPKEFEKKAGDYTMFLTRKQVEKPKE
ncbi:MAG TPA: hypothetical protein VMY05_10720 [Acidobacteriota bacterium]|nr:hypothetical protein [Acidobacteriota bacterium]